MVNVAVLGHILNEKIIFPDKIIQAVLGSPAAYSSVCMALLGVDVGIVTKIGSDFPESLLEVYSKTRVNIKGLKVGKYSTNNELIYGSDGRKTIKFMTKAEEIYFNDIPEEYYNAKVFYVCPINYEISTNTIKELSRLKRILAIDLGGYGGGTSESHPEIKNGSKIRELCPYFKIVKVSIEDLYYILGPNITETDASEKMIDWGAEIVVITLGEKGSYVKTSESEKYIPPYPIEKFVDQTGAGDCFFAGFMAQYLECSDPFISAAYGNAATSYIIERSGGVVAERMPSKEEVEKRVKVLT